MNTSHVFSNISSRFRLSFLRISLFYVFFPSFLPSYLVGYIFLLRYQTWNVWDEFKLKVMFCNSPVLYIFSPNWVTSTSGDYVVCYIWEWYESLQLEVNHTESLHENCKRAEDSVSHFLFKIKWLVAGSERLKATSAFSSKHIS